MIFFKKCYATSRALVFVPIRFLMCHANLGNLGGDGTVSSLMIPGFALPRLPSPTVHQYCTYHDNLCSLESLRTVRVPGTVRTVRTVRTSYWYHIPVLYYRYCYCTLPYLGRDRYIYPPWRGLVGVWGWDELTPARVLTRTLPTVTAAPEA